jgi:thioredoxin 1
MSKLIKLTNANFNDVVLKAKVPVAVDFFGNHCLPCRALKPVLAALADDLGRPAIIGTVDVARNESLLKRFGINLVPTIIVFKVGREVDRMVGLADVARLRESLGV